MSLADVRHSMERPKVDKRKLGGAADSGSGPWKPMGFGKQITHLDLIGEDNTVTKRRADFFHAR